MNPSALNIEFNAAIAKGDWSSVRLFGEKALAEGIYSPDVLYNLAVAYLKAGDRPMAAAILVSLPESMQRGLFKDALEEALKGSGYELSDINLSAHGLSGLMMEASIAVSKGSPYAVTAFSLPILVVLILLKRNSKKILGKSLAAIQARVVNALLVLMLTFVVAGGLMILLTTFYSGQWCAAIGDRGAQFWASARGKGDAIKSVNPGAPIFVLDDATKDWLFALEPSGLSGWVDSLQVRCIVDKH